MIDERQTRRQFLRVGAVVAAGAATAAVTGCSATPAAHASDKTTPRWVMVIDLKKCSGCRACVVACKAENHTPPGVAYNVLMEDEPLADGMPFLPRPCMQCENSSCAQVCPTGATYHRPDGIVAVDYDRCIGCRYCIAACPYGARSFDYGEDYRQFNPFYPVASRQDKDGETKAAGRTFDARPSPEYGENRVREHGRSPEGTVRKCTFCLHRIYQRDANGKLLGLQPACVASCLGGALNFGNVNNSDDAIHNLLDFSDSEAVVGRNGRSLLVLKEQLGNRPSVYYLT